MAAAGSLRIAHYRGVLQPLIGNFKVAVDGERSGVDGMKHETNIAFAPGGREICLTRISYWVRAALIDRLKPAKSRGP